MSSFRQRVLGCALLRAESYEEIEADRGATLQAGVVVVLAAAAAGVGGIANHGAPGILWHAAAQLLGWWIWAYLTWFLGTRLLPGLHTSADPGELLRTTGFACAPGVLRALGLFSPVAGAVFLVSGLWMLVAMVIAVRQALDYHRTAPALLVCALGFPIYALIQVTSLLLLGPWPV
jgi:hypothetical protein